jgi:subtilisin family serine protease
MRSPSAAPQWAVAAIGLLLPAHVGAGELRIDPVLRADAAKATGDAPLSAVVRLPDVTPAQRAALEAEGIRFRLAPDGRTRHLGDLHPVDATADALARLARRGTSVRVSRRLEIAPALYSTAIETQAIDLWGHGPTPTRAPLQRRLVVGAFDTGLNLFHPHFFRADGGAWPWVDVDGDGVFTPGVDAVDADRDGEIADNERLELLDYGFWVGETAYGGSGTFDTAWDYLYLDLDGSGVREHGPMAGYTEDSPGYGEAMFLPDDANGDGRLELDERVVLLGTSQVAGMWSGGAIWTRGVDLISAPPRIASEPTASHGAGTTGTMTGGQTHPFRANRGLVPDADIAIVVYDEPFSPSTEAMMVEAMAWMTQDMGAAVVNHSWGTRGNRIHLDGSNVIDAVIDAASAEGSTQVCAAGNRRVAGKHRATTTSSGMASFTATMPTRVSDIVPNEITFDLHWPADAGSFACSVVRPDGAMHEIQEIPDGDFDGLVVDAFRLDSERGWALLSIEISQPTGAHVGAGVWRFECLHDGGDDVLVHGMISDGITYQAPGAVFSQPTETSTAVSPGVADGCITAGGYPIQHSQYGAQLGDLEPYSSLGPRFDGAVAVDVAAPVDAVVPTVDPERPNGYTAFSGTSGATPQVAAIAALLVALEPELSPEDIRQRIRDGAAVDAQVGSGELPDPGWGYGKLRGYRALTGDAPPPRPRVAAIELAIDYAYADGDCAATVSVDGADWDDASFRWDFEYDGTWDTDFEAADARTMVYTDEGERFSVRVDAGERGFIVAGAVLTGEVPATCFVPPPGGSSDGGTHADSGDSDASSGNGPQPPDTDGDGPQQAADARGCGCRHTSGGGADILPLALLLAIGLRRTSAASRRSPAPAIRAARPRFGSGAAARPCTRRCSSPSDTPPDPRSRDRLMPRLLHAVGRTAEARRNPPKSNLASSAGDVSVPRLELSVPTTVASRCHGPRLRICRARSSSPGRRRLGRRPSSWPGGWLWTSRAC